MDEVVVTVNEVLALFAEKVSLVEEVVLKVPKSIVNAPAPTNAPVLLTAPLTNECAEANWLTTSEELISSLSVVPVFVKVAVVVLLEDPVCVDGPASCKALQIN